MIWDVMMLKFETILLAGLSVLLCEKDTGCGPHLSPIWHRDLYLKVDLFLIIIGLTAEWNSERSDRQRAGFKTWTSSLDTSSLSAYKVGPSLAGPGGPVPTLAAEEKQERWGDLHSKNKSENANKGACAWT